MQKIVTFLWFEHQAEEAARFYTGIFPNSRIKHSSPMITGFELDGQTFMALNGNRNMEFTEAISLYVHCSTQEEVDHYWNAFLAEGSASMCGWLKDKYGVSWQIIPDQLSTLLNDPDKTKAERVMQAMLCMRKIDIQGLQDAYDGK
ncbi:MAG: VOC family protein [Chitinophagales bacterium]